MDIRTSIKNNKMELRNSAKDNKMGVKSFIQNINNNINENKVFEKSFDRLVNLQTLLKKESALKELCKILIYL